MTPEGRVAHALTTHVAAIGGIVRKVSWEGRIGAPDYLIMVNNHSAFVETKAPGEKPRPSQVREFARITAHSGLSVYVVDSVESAREIVERIARGEA